MSDSSSEISSEIKDAFHTKTALRIEGGASKSFYGRNINGKTLSTSRHTGIIEYEPSELYITAKSGTLLSVIEQTISEHNQILPFEPPYFKETATIGGTVACGLSGPRRAYAGSIRDCILGTEITNGKGETLRFGGKVMKNVAGYDASRLMCGALGTLGVLMNITIRLLPKPAFQQTTVLEMDENTALCKMNDWAKTPLPISATAYYDNHLYARLSGSKSAVSACIQEIGGESLIEHNDFWNNVKEQQHPFFKSEKPLWRISIPPNTNKLPLSGETFTEWNGGLRWYKTEIDEDGVRDAANQVGGHATLFKAHHAEEKFQPLPDQVMKIHKQLKNVFDPGRILNPGKIFAEL